MWSLVPLPTIGLGLITMFLYYITIHEKFKGKTIASHLLKGRDEVAEFIVAVFLSIATIIVVVPSLKMYLNTSFFLISQPNTGYTTLFPEKAVGYRLVTIIGSFTIMAVPILILKIVEVNEEKVGNLNTTGKTPVSRFSSWIVKKINIVVKKVATTIQVLAAVVTFVGFLALLMLNKMHLIHLF